MNKLQLLLPRQLYRMFYYAKNRRRLLTYRDPYAETRYSGFHSLRCIFIHIPKTGGVSVNNALFGSLGGGHKTAKDYELILGDKLFQRYLRFTFVRNPYTRLISAYLFLKSGGFDVRDSDWAEGNLREYDSFRHFVFYGLVRQSILNYPHFRPQHTFLSTARAAIDVDFVGRFERLSEDFSVVSEMLGAEVSLAHFNKRTAVTNYMNYYDRDIAGRVKEVYKRDFDLLQYSTDIDLSSL